MAIFGSRHRGNPVISASAIVWVFYAAAVFAEDAVRIHGQPNKYAGRFFCPCCDSSVFARSGDEIEVHLGALDVPDQFVPDYELWKIRRESWLPPFHGINHHERERDGSDRDEG